jgi:ABC-type antimicrobial peptide transport system permease subunit
MKMETIGQHLSLSLFPVRLAAAALGLLGMVGALLASVGVYAVVAFGVAQRTREIGIRMAIGADRARVVRMVVRQGMRLILVGAALGLAISLASTRVLSSLLYGVSATDVSAYAGAALALGLVGMLANLIPALRASRVNPTTALRSN